MLRALLSFCITLLLSLSADLVLGADPPQPLILPNGMRVIVRERHTSPLVAIDLWVRAGSREEQPEEAGSAHFIEHTLFKGTTTRGPGQVDIDIENLGATLNAATGPDYAHFYTTVASAHLAEALGIVADVVRHAILPDSEIEHERGVILDELAQRDADPIAHLIDLLYANAISDYPYRHPPGGAAEAIRVRGRDTLAAFYRRTYLPNRCTLALAGDLTEKNAHALVVRAFGDWTAPEGTSQRDASAVGTVLFDQAGTAKEWSTPRRAEVQGQTGRGAIGIAFRSPGAGDLRMACAALVTAALLGEDGSGRLSRGVLTGTDAAARYTPRSDPGLFLLTVSQPVAENTPFGARALAPPVDLAALETALLDAVRSLQNSPPSPAEFARAKGRVSGAAAFDNETNAGMAHALGYADIVHGDSPEALRARVQQLTQNDLMQFVRLYLDPGHRVTVRILPTGGKP
jgi:zinc protease